MTSDDRFLVQELALILRGEHPAWEGDRRANGTAFLKRMILGTPSVAATLGADIGRNVNHYSNVSGISPSTLRLAARILIQDPALIGAWL